MAGDSIYGNRIDAVSELQPKDQLIEKYRKKEEALAQARAQAPVATGMNGADLSKAVEHSLKDNSTGKRPLVPTTFSVGWDKDFLVVDIVCHEPEMKLLSISGDVHSGDNIAVSIETPLHSYYHLEVNPNGDVAEGNPGPNWKSLAEVKTERGNDSWSVRLRIPVVDEAEAQSDPRHRVAGRKPTAQSPWYFNVGRQRVLNFAKPELQAFSPTKAGWHVPEKFGKLTID